ncbi:hypothetical protein G3I44_14505 [Halogeometricum borinquense]|uniref:MarR family transcriptional regulator n=1 Tax=Halogeometricum borinquense TaxID=60847 RepID=A0A6C0UR31_9EURY|nr:hypothetical protein [Halogeometricum borinquense]QIB75398.1 hypothetical protein G3I44_14505 [Halogeometricum borinquense]
MLTDTDLAVLAQIRDGHDTSTAIREQSTLDQKKVQYRLNKLEDHGHITTETPDRWVVAEYDGNERRHRAPKQAELTDKGLAALIEDEERTEEAAEAYEGYTRDELVATVKDLEETVDRLEARQASFERQVRQLLDG